MFSDLEDTGCCHNFVSIIIIRQCIFNNFPVHDVPYIIYNNEVPADITTRNVTFYDEYLMTLDQNVTRSFPFMTFYIGWYNLATKTRCSSLRQDENCHKLVLLHVVTNAFLSLESNYKRHNFMTTLNCH